MKKLLIGLFLVLQFNLAYAADFPTLPYTFVARQLISASKVMANYNALRNGIIDGTKKINVAELWINGIKRINSSGVLVEDNVYKIPGEYATLALAVAAIGSATANIEIDSVTVETVGTTVPENVIQISFGALGQIGSAVTVTFNGQFLNAPSDQQIFGDNVTLAGTLANGMLFAEWKGAIPDDGIADGSAISAISSLGDGSNALVLRGDRTYELAQKVADNVDVVSSITSIGGKATIESLGTASTIEINADNIDVSNIVFSKVELYTTGDSKTNIYNNEFKNAYNNAISIHESSSSNIYDNDFENIGINPAIDKTFQGMAIYGFNNQGLNITNNDISFTYGQGAIFTGGDLNFEYSFNRIHDTAYRAINIGNKTTHGGNIKSNTIFRTGVLNSTGSGVGCNGIFVETYTGVGDVYVLNNSIRDVVENGIEGKARVIQGNLIVNTGISPISLPTPSDEGIFVSDECDVIGNTVINSQSEGILVFKTEAVSSINIFGNILIGDNDGDSVGVFLQTNPNTVTINNVSIGKNTIKNYQKGIRVSIQTGATIGWSIYDNKYIDVSRNVEFANGAQNTYYRDDSGIDWDDNQNFSFFTDAGGGNYEADDWTDVLADNDRLANDVASKSYSCKVTNTIGTLDGYIAKDIGTNWVDNIIHVRFEHKVPTAAQQARFRAIRYEDDALDFGTVTQVDFDSSTTEWTESNITLTNQADYGKIRIGIGHDTVGTGNYILLRKVEIETYDNYNEVMR